MSLNDIKPLSKTEHLIRDSMLRDRFRALWRRCLRPGKSGIPDDVWAELERRYSEPHRHYHDQQHLAHCLEQLDLAASEIRDPDQVEIAIWFHDVVNEPGRNDNEQRSADYFKALADDRMDPDFVAAVVDLILVTTHRDRPKDLDHQFICDIDLTSFGCPWECFMRDSEAVKAEFPGPDADYYRSKAAFLRGLLQRPKIFLTEFFNARYEQQARENIRQLLALIERHRE